MDHYYPDYKDTTPDAHRFGADQIQLTPLVIPFHDAMVEFLERKGRWSKDLQTRQDALLERERRMHEAWPAFWQDHKDREDPKSARKEWVDWKKANLPELPDTPGTLPGASSTTAPSGGHA